mmetsp:Transcript_45961/g.132541  ORF Transcript_45961/g.132541 Transcript_45961/m.132541 type:complete len:251 (+) Transcript_45961:119-871(+)
MPAAARAAMARRRCGHPLRRCSVAAVETAILAIALACAAPVRAVRMAPLWVGASPPPPWIEFRGPAVREGAGQAQEAREEAMEEASVGASSQRTGRDSVSRADEAAEERRQVGVREILDQAEEQREATEDEREGSHSHREDSAQEAEATPQAERATPAAGEQRAADSKPEWLLQRMSRHLRHGAHKLVESLAQVDFLRAVLQLDTDMERVFGKRRAAAAPARRSERSDTPVPTVAGLRRDSADTDRERPP